MLQPGAPCGGRRSCGSEPRHLRDAGVLPRGHAVYASLLSDHRECESIASAQERRNRSSGQAPLAGALAADFIRLGRCLFKADNMRWCKSHHCNALKLAPDPAESAPSWLCSYNVTSSCDETSSSTACRRVQAGRSVIGVRSFRWQYCDRD